MPPRLGANPVPRQVRRPDARYKRGAAPVYTRAAERGRMLPIGVTYIDSWIDERTLDRCFQLMETDDLRLLEEWTANWSDLVEFDIVPVISSADAAARARMTTVE